MNTLFKKLNCGKKNSYMVVLASVVSAFVLIMDGILDDFQWFGDNASGVTSFYEASAREKLVDLEGEWRFSKGDDLDWGQADFDDGDWEMIATRSARPNLGMAFANLPLP